MYIRSSSAHLGYQEYCFTEEVLAAVGGTLGGCGDEECVYPCSSEDAEVGVVSHAEEDGGGFQVVGRGGAVVEVHGLLSS